MTQASRGIRVAATLATLGFGLVAYGIGLLLTKVTGQTLALVVTVVLCDVIAVLLLATRAASPGQLVLGLVTTDVTTGRPTGGKALAKGAVMAVAATLTAGIGLLVGLLIKKSGTNQHLFDRLLGVSVVRRTAAAKGAAGQPAGRVLAPSSAFLAGAPLGSALVPATSPPATPSIPTPPLAPALAPASVPASFPAAVPTVASATTDAPTMVGNRAPASSPVTPHPPAPPRTVVPPPPPAPTAVSAMPQLQEAPPPPPPPPTAASAATVWRLELDQGSVLPLDRVWVFGRAPQPPPVFPTAEPFTIPDLAMSLSKTHLAVLPTPGGASVVDLHSTNGVTLGHPDGRAMKLTPGDAVPLEAGSVITFGRRTIMVHA